METSTNQSLEGVKAFHEAFGHAVGEKPTAIPVETAVKRSVWTAEEVVEFLHASVAGDPEQFLEVVGELKKGIDKAVEKQLAIGEIEQDHVVVAQADALTDILYFVYGSFVVQGTNSQPLFDIVQRANMAKLGPDGKPIIRPSDGKIMKPDGWVAPEPLLEAEINRQIELS